MPPRDAENVAGRMARPRLGRSSSWKRTALVVAAVVAASSAQTVEIGLHANATLNSIVGYDDLLYFEPYFPLPSEATLCAEECPCFFPGNPTCDCGLETVCGGGIPLDLSSGSDLMFRWEATAPGDDEAKFISITGNDRTEVELRLHIPNCQSAFQDIDGADISFEIDDAGLDATQRYTYNPGESFLALGTCDDGCAQECDIFTRVQFDPDESGVLDMKFRRLSIGAAYDPQNVVEGEREYKWSTNSYLWMRQPEGGSIELLPASAPMAEASTSTPTQAPYAIPAATTGTPTAAPEEPASRPSPPARPGGEPAEPAPMESTSPTASPTKSGASSLVAGASIGMVASAIVACWA